MCGPQVESSIKSDTFYFCSNSSPYLISSSLNSTLYRHPLFPILQSLSVSRKLKITNKISLNSSSHSISMDSCITSSPFDTLIFDLDDTLYSSNTGIGQALKQNVTDYISQKCGIPESEASNVNRKLFTTYGSSLAGLRAIGYDINPDEYHSFVHGRLPYHLIKQNSRLRSLLLTIKQRKIIFTNSDRIHAMKALDRLGISDCFEMIICFETMNPNLFRPCRPDEFPVVLKPSPEAFRIAIDESRVDPGRAIFFDDNAKNVATGKAFGLWTVLVGKAVKSNGADYALEKITNMAQVIPQVWISKEEEDQQENGNGHRLTRTRSEMDSIMANPTAVGA